MIGSVTLLVPATTILMTMQAYHIGYCFDKISPLLILLILLFVYFELLQSNSLDLIYKRANKLVLWRYWLTAGIVLLFIVITGLQSHNRQPSYLAYMSIDFYLLSFLFLVTVNYRTTFKIKVELTPIILTIGLLITILFILVNIDQVQGFVTKCHVRTYPYSIALLR